MDNDELTASHWDDVLAPGQSGFNTYQDILGNDPWKDPPKQRAYGDPGSDEDEDEEHPPQEQPQPDQLLPEVPPVESHPDPIVQQQKDLNRERHRDMVTQLTAGVEHDVSTPKVVSTSDALFHDKGSPIQLKMASSSASSSLPIKAINYRAIKPRKYAKRVVKELTDDTKGPLEGPQSPRKDSSLQSTYEKLVDEVNSPLFEREAKPVADVAKGVAEIKLDPPQSVSESEPQTKVPNLYSVSVGDPMKVGELTKAHIVYNVKTKYKGTVPETYQVTRRYRDFRWLYNQLQTNHPGRIIPPPPSKSMFIGRFNENLIEDRRLSLEKMLSKILERAVFREDDDFRAFLMQPDLEIKGEGADGEVDESEAGVSSFMGFFTGATKVEETDAWFTAKRDYIEEVESNLKQFSRALNLIGTQRFELVGLYDEISATVADLAQLEISKTTTDVLDGFVDVQSKLRQNMDRVNLQDSLTLGFTIDEYLRLIRSITHVLETRTKLATQLHSYQQDLQKKSAQLEKQRRRNAVSESLSFEVGKLTEKVDNYNHRFEEISATIKEEMASFEVERINDFRNAVEIFIESSIESQKEAIEVYETFYERQGLSDGRQRNEERDARKDEGRDTKESGGNGVKVAKFPDTPSNVNPQVPDDPSESAIPEQETSSSSIPQPANSEDDPNPK